MEATTKTCETCALYLKDQSGCLRSQHREKPDHYCGAWIDELLVCDICGQAFLPPAKLMYMSPESEAAVIMCHQCFAKRNTCQLCKHGSYCDFQENKECTLPQMVQKTIQRDNMIVSTTVPNEARIEETCKKNCACYHEEFICCSRMSFGTCGKYEMRNRHE